MFIKQCPFPNQADTQAATPDAWNHTFGNRRIRIIIDTTNINVHTARDPDVSNATYSKYYGGNVAKVNVGIISSGVITFASLAYPEKISDVAIANTLQDCMTTICRALANSEPGRLAL
jgi:hypothetical protein